MLMASTHNLAELMADPHFQQLVTDILEVVAKAQGKPGTTANMANDALTFVNAMISEANPYQSDRKGLRAVHKGLSDDALAMLRALRDHTQKTGQPMLFKIKPSPVINKRYYGDNLPLSNQGRNRQRHTYCSDG